MIQSFLKRHRKFRFLPNRAKASGFTLVELLVAMVVASLISMGLLFLVVQLVQTNLREAARSDTQRDLQAALDYIARDVREAVYVYDASCLLTQPITNSPSYPNASSCPGLRNYLPTTISGTSGFGATDSNGNLVNVPVLAFWRLKPLPSTLQSACTNAASAYSTTPPSLPAGVQGVPCLTGQMYSLVVYSLNNSPGAVAKGRARIMRYELPQFTNQSVQSGQAPASPTATPGWTDPTGNAPGDGNPTSFVTWPVSSQMLTGTLTVPASRLSDINPLPNLPLTDFVDWYGTYNYNASGVPVSIGQPPDRSTGSNTTNENLILTPANGSPAATSPPRGFYVYVKGAGDGGSFNQQVVIRIQGDAVGRPGVPNIAPLTQPVVPISLETTVLTRGVTNKTY